MPITARPRPVIVKSMQESVKALQTDMDSSSGPIKDVVIDPVAEQLANFEATLAYASKLRALENAAELLEEDLDSLGADYGVPRGTGSYSRGIILFERSSPPISDVTIPAGTIVKVPGTNLSFYTSTQVVMYAALSARYLISARGRYGIKANIVATQPGSVFNVGTGKITSISGSITGIDGCYNQGATSSGSDIETNLEYATRISAVLRGTDRSSTGGTAREVVTFDPSVLDIYVAQGTDHLLTRTSTALPRDIYITGFSGETIQEVFVPAGTPGDYDDYTLLSQPVLGISGIYNSSTGSPLTEGVHYTLLKDTSDLGGSVRASDAISFMVSPTAASFTVVYDTNRTVAELQAHFDSYTHSLLGTDTLIKEGVKVDLYVTMRISILPGYSLSDIRDEVSLTIRAAVNTGKFGDGKTLVYSEPLRLEVLNSVAGVSSLIFTQFSRVRSRMMLEQFYLGLNEYLYLNPAFVSWA